MISAFKGSRMRSRQTTCAATVRRLGARCGRIWRPGQLARSCRPIGIFTPADTKKTSGTCAEPDHIGTCPLPTHRLRNGHLNQIAYSLYLFIRDVTDGDLVGWID